MESGVVGAVELLDNLAWIEYYGLSKYVAKGRKSGRVVQAVVRAPAVPGSSQAEPARRRAARPGQLAAEPATHA